MEDYLVLWEFHRVKKIRCSTERLLFSKDHWHLLFHHSLAPSVAMWLCTVTPWFLWGRICNLWYSPRCGTWMELELLVVQGWAHGDSCCGFLRVDRQQCRCKHSYLWLGKHTLNEDDSSWRCSFCCLQVIVWMTPKEERCLGHMSHVQGSIVLDAGVLNLSWAVTWF